MWPRTACLARAIAPGVALCCAGAAKEASRLEPSSGSGWFSSWRQTASVPAASGSAGSQSAQQAILLRRLAIRVEAVLSDPPHALQRVSRAWRKHADRGALDALHAAQFGLREAVVHAAQARSARPEADLKDSVLGTLASTLAAAERAVGEARSSAVRAAESVPWGVALRGVMLERADGRDDDATPLAALNGKVVGLYYTASWCGPCHQFSPALVQLHARAKAAGRPFEVVQVPWDEDPDARRKCKLPACSRAHTRDTQSPRVVYI